MYYIKNNLLFTDQVKKFQLRQFFWLYIGYHRILEVLIFFIDN